MWLKFEMTLEAQVDQFPDLLNTEDTDIQYAIGLPLTERGKCIQICMPNKSSQMCMSLSSLMA